LDGLVLNLRSLLLLPFHIVQEWRDFNDGCALEKQPGHVPERRLITTRTLMATKRARRTKRRTWSKADVRELKAYSRSKSPVKKKIAKVMKRTVGALRQKALSLGLPLGHRR
jgi:hypothetical protein